MAKAAPLPALMEPMPAFDVDKLGYEIFSILESRFLFGYDESKLLLRSDLQEAPSPANGPTRTATETATSVPGGAGKVRILSIDGVAGASDGILAAATLARLESSLRRRSGDPSARVADYFDVAAGSGAGGVLASMLFTRGPDGRSLFTADDALSFFAGRPRNRLVARPRRGLLRGMLRRPGGGGKGALHRVFGDATLRDALKPLLVPCYDVATAAPVLFSRADAVEAKGCDFKIADVCTATCGGGVGKPPVEVRSVDGGRKIVAVGGGAVMANPTAAAITHVLNNKQEFPFAASAEDLVVVSLGTFGGEVNGVDVCRAPSTAELVRIAGESAADMVDQAVSMAFGHSRASNYLRILGNANALIKCRTDASKLAEAVDNMMSQRNLESLLFRGKKVSEQTNGGKLEALVGELIKEQERRRHNNNNNNNKSRPEFEQIVAPSPLRPSPPAIVSPKFMCR